MLREEAGRVATGVALPQASAAAAWPEPTHWESVGATWPARSEKERSNLEKAPAIMACEYTWAL